MSEEAILNVKTDITQAGTSRNTRGLFSLVFLRTLVFKPFLKASCSISMDDRAVLPIP